MVPGDLLRAGTLDAGDGHRLHWEVHGTPGGKPAVVLHGGPGSGSSAGPPRAFDLDAYRVVQFDQRGCAGGDRPLPVLSDRPRARRG